MHNVTDLLVTHVKRFPILVQKCFSHKNNFALKLAVEWVMESASEGQLFTYIENWGFAAMVCFVKDTRREGSVGLCEGA